MARCILNDEINPFLGVVGMAVKRNARAIRLGRSGFFPKAGYFALQIALLVDFPAIEMTDAVGKMS
jgi:hypothetical protein